MGRFLGTLGIFATAALLGGCAHHWHGYGPYGWHGHHGWHDAHHVDQPLHGQPTHQPPHGYHGHGGPHGHAHHHHAGVPVEPLTATIPVTGDCSAPRCHEPAGRAR